MVSLPHLACSLYTLQPSNLDCIDDYGSGICWSRFCVWLLENAVCCGLTTLRALHYSSTLKRAIVYRSFLVVSCGFLYLLISHILVFTSLRLHLLVFASPTRTAIPEWANSKRSLLPHSISSVSKPQAVERRRPDDTFSCHSLVCFRHQNYDHALKHPVLSYKYII